MHGSGPNVASSTSIEHHERPTHARSSTATDDGASHAGVALNAHVPGSTSGRPNDANATAVNDPPTQLSTRLAGQLLAFGA